jgi:hypothetical protein
MNSTESPSIRLSAGDRDFHRREAARLRAVAKTITTTAVRNRILDQAQTHEWLAGRTSEDGAI